MFEFLPVYFATVFTRQVVHVVAFVLEVLYDYRIWVIIVTGYMEPRRLAA